MSTKVGIISDTHGVLHPDMMEELMTCDYVLHAGDFAERRILDKMVFPGKFYAVKGNCDRWWAREMDEKQRFRIEGLRFLLIHDRTKAGPDARNADVIVHGHTHHFSEEVTGGRLWLNPGSCGSVRGGDGLSYVIMEIDGRDYSVKKMPLIYKTEKSIYED